MVDIRRVSAEEFYGTDKKDTENVKVRRLPSDQFYSEQSNKHVLRPAPAPTPPQEGLGIGGSFVEMGKSYVRNNASLAQTMTGAGTEMVGNMLSQHPVDIAMDAASGLSTMSPLPLDDKAVGFVRENVLGPKQEAGTNPFLGAREASQKVFGPIAEAPILKEDPRIAGVEYLGDAPIGTKISKGMSDVGGALPSQTPTIAAGLAFGTTGARIVGGAIEGAAQYEQGLQEGLTQEQAFKEAAVVGGGVGLLSGLPFDDVFKGVVPKRLQGKIASFIRSGVLESGSEATEGGLDPFGQIASGRRKIESLDDVKKFVSDVATGVWEETSVIPATFITGGIGGALGDRGPRKIRSIPPELTKEAVRLAAELEAETPNTPRYDPRITPGRPEDNTDLDELEPAIRDWLLNTSDQTTIKIKGKTYKGRAKVSEAPPQNPDDAIDVTATPVDALRPGPNAPNDYASFDEDNAPWVPQEPPVVAPEATNAPAPIVPAPEQQVAPEAPVEQLSPEYQALLDENPELAALLRAANQQPTAEQTALEQSILGQDLIDSREAKSPVEVRKPAPPLIEARPALDVARPVEEQAPEPQTARDKFLARVSVRAQDRPRPDANRPTVTPEPTNVRATVRNMSQKDVAPAVEPEPKPAATFKGMQPRPRGQEPIPLYNIPDGKGGQTTVSAETAAAQGYSVPEPPVEAEAPTPTAKEKLAAKVDAVKGKSRSKKQRAGDLDRAIRESEERVVNAGVIADIREALSAEPKEEARKSRVSAWRSQFSGNPAEVTASGDIAGNDWEKASTTKVPTQRLYEMIDSAIASGALFSDAKPDTQKKLSDYGKQKIADLRGESAPTQPLTATANRAAMPEQREGTNYEKTLGAIGDTLAGNKGVVADVKSEKPKDTEAKFQEGIRAIIAEAKEKRLKDLRREFMQNKGLSHTQENGVQQILHMSSKKSGSFQLSSIGADGIPNMDQEFDNLSEAIAEFDRTVGSRRADLPDIAMMLKPGEANFIYEPRLRPVDIGTIPKEGFVGRREGGKWGRAAFNRPLTQKELDQYELTPVGYEDNTGGSGLIEDAMNEKPTTQEKVQALREKAKPKSKRKAPSKWLGGMDVAEDTKDKTLASGKPITKKAYHSNYMANIAIEELESIGQRSDRARSSDKAKRDADKAWSSLTTHAGKLGISMPRRGTYFNIDSDIKLADEIRKQLTPRDDVYSAPETGRKPKLGGDEAGYVNVGAIKEIGGIVFEAATKPVVFEQGFGAAKPAVAERRAKLKSFEMRGKHIAMDFDNGFRKLYKRLNPGLKGKLVNRFASIPDEIVNQLNDYLEQADPDLKADALMELPPELRQPAVKMRELIDNMTDYMLSLGIVEDEQGMAFADNKGVYLRRTYDIFTDPDFRERRDPRLKETLRKWLQKEYPEYSKEEINGIITDLDGTGLSATSTNNMIARGKALGQMDRRTLGRREDIPQEVMDFWGVSRNGYDRFLDTINSQAHVIANYEFLSNMAENLDGISVATASTLRDIKRGEYTGDNADEIMSWPYLNDADTARSIRRMSRRRESVSNKEQAIATALEKLGKLPDSQKKTEMVEKLRDDALMLKLGLKRDKAGVMSVDPENLEAAAAYLEALTAEVSSLGKKKGKDATKLRKDLDKYTRQYNKAEGDAATDENLPNMFGSFGPLAGARIHPDLKKALQDALAIKERSEFVDALRGINSQMKQNVTTRNPASAVRNLTSGFDFSMANGWILYGNSFKRLGEAMAIANVDISRNHDPKLREWYLRAAELGVAGDTVVIGDITATAANAKKPKKIRDFIRKYPEIAKAMGGPDAVAQKLYQAGDDVFKIFGWLTETEHLMDIGMSRKEAEVEAALRVRNQFPTYSELPKWAQWFKASPVVGPFVAYKTETYRTAYNTVVQAVTEVKSKDPKVRRMGYRRLAGIGAASISRNALKIMLFAAFAIDPDDEDAIQMAAPVFYQDHTLGIVEADKAKGLYEGYNLSTSDAYNVLKEPMYAALRGEGVGETVSNAAITIGRDYISPEMGASLIAELLANIQGKSSTIFKKSDTAGEKWLKSAMRVGLDVGVPGGARGFLKAETPEDVINETVTQFTGLKTIKIDMPNDLLYKARALTAIPREQATDVYKQIRAKDIAGAKAEIAKVNQTRKEQFMVVHKAYTAYKAAGTRTDLLDDALKQAGLSQKSIDSVKYGLYEDWEGSKPMKEALGQ